jgi:hypothetical protein
MLAITAQTTLYHPWIIKTINSTIFEVADLIKIPEIILAENIEQAAPTELVLT